MPTNASAPPPERRYRRRWRIPPAYLRGSEPIEGAAILEEFPGPPGLLLWQCMRDVTLWTLTPADQREGLFSADAEQRRLAALLTLGDPVREVEEPLRALASMLSQPADIAPEAVMLACGQVAQWAEVRGGIATTLAFAQAAAMAAPGSARASLRVGQLARRRGEYARAEGWLQRAIVLARQNREREVHAWSYTALGYLYFLRGNMPAAERSHHRALRIARRHSLISREAAALHDLFAMAVESGRHADALRWAQDAVRTYGPRHPNLPVLAHDIAVLWIHQGRFTPAIAVLQAAAARIGSPKNVMVLSNLARAAGGAGDRSTFDAAWSRVLALTGQPAVADLAPTALLNLARGAFSLREWERAEDVLHRALDAAVSLGEHRTVFEAEALAEAVRSERASRSPAAADADPSWQEEAEPLAAELLHSLSSAG